jgi:hypothetical protein
MFAVTVPRADLVWLLVLRHNLAQPDPSPRVHGRRCRVARANRRREERFACERVGRHFRRGCEMNGIDQVCVNRVVL